MLHENSSPEALGIARIGLYSIWLAELIRNPPMPLAQFPVDWFQPTGIYHLIPARLIPPLLQPGALGAAYAFCITAAVLAILGFRPFTPLAVLAAIGSLLHACAFKSFYGMVNHAEMVMLLSLWLIVPFPASDAISVFGRRRTLSQPAVYSAALISMTMSLAVVYSAVAAYRLVKGKPIVFFNDTILRYIGMQSMNYSIFGFRAGLAVLQSPALAVMVKIGFFATTLCELLSPLCLFYTRLRWIWLLVILSFHVCTLLTMNLFFWHNILLILLLFTKFPHAFGRSPGDTEKGAPETDLPPKVTAPGQS